MNKLIIFILISVTFLTDGCYYGSPSGNLGFSDISHLNSIAGRYKNRGETGALTGDIYLSELMWGYDYNFDQSTIDEVEIIVKNEKQITVKAYSGSTVVRNETYTKGKHFNITNGRIEIIREKSTEGNVIVGPMYSNTELGIDKDGNAKYRIEGAVVGLVYLVLPVAGASREDIRFLRVDKQENR